MHPFASTQRTIQKTVSLQGIGVHSGHTATLTLSPLPESSGIIFERTDVMENNRIPSSFEAVVDTRFSTTLSNPHGITISTIEHLMAALAAFQINNVLVQVSGPEMPIMDGSSAAFVTLLHEAGVLAQQAPQPILKILKPIEIVEENRWIRLNPSPNFGFDVTIDFHGREGLTPQTQAFSLSQEGFEEDISFARSFGFFQDAEKLYALGLAKGSSLENAVIIQEGAIMNPQGLRYGNEMVRHKILDALGDFYLGGCLIQGTCHALNPGHEFNNRLMCKVLADASAYTFVTAADLPKAHTQDVLTFFRPKKFMPSPAALSA
jgi:UDP-3-O-[3-hydroxymyristoyl] N-acetylglucosamine deacetylase